MNNKPIGILDSGVGGLSILQKITSSLPHESIIYIADSKNCPYGSKSKEEIFKLSKRLIEFLLTKEAKLIVIACNTITVTNIDRLRKEFPQIPLIGIVPVVKTATSISKNKKIGILSTTQTAKSKYQKRLIQQFAKNCEVINIGTDTLVPFIERGDIDSLAFKSILQKELQPFLESGIDVLALGCSHFPFIKTHIQEIVGPKVQILDSSGAVARQIKRVLENNDILSSAKQNQKYEFYTTGNEEQFVKMVHIYCLNAGEIARVSLA